MKSILISKPPKQVVNILNRKQSIIISKTAPKEWVDYLSGKTKEKPKLMTGYIYCTKDKTNTLERNAGEPFDFFILNNKKHLVFKLDKKYIGYNAKVLAKFTLRKIEEVERYTNEDFGVYDRWWEEYGTADLDEKELLKLSCLQKHEIGQHLKWDKSDYAYGYAWYISDLVIFDKPKELSDFGILDETIIYWSTAAIERTYKAIKRPPQSWRYVEELK